MNNLITDPDIKDKLLWLVRLRWAGCIGVLVATHAVRETADLSFPIIPVYLILGFTASYNVYFHRRIKTMTDNFRQNAVMQIGLDYFVLAAAIYFSGGCDSPFLYYYVFHIVISGIILPKIWTFGFALTAVALPTAIVGLKHLHILPHFAIFRNEPMIFLDISVMAAYGGVFASTLFFTAYFITYLSERLYRKQAEIKRLYMLSEKLRSSIMMDEVIGIIEAELSSIEGIGSVVYMELDNNKLALSRKDDTGFAITLLDKTAFSDALLTGETRVINRRAVGSDYENRVFKEIMKDAAEIAVLPVYAASSAKCYEIYHCPDDSGCPAYGQERTKCWAISGTYCHGKVMRNRTEKLRQCIECDAFSPVGIFIVDITQRSRLDSKCELDVCMRLLDSAGLAVSNARLYEKTLELSEIDGLTGLKNRRTFLKTLDMEIARSGRYNKNFGLLMLDVDHFKKYNDTNGHPQGDVLLRTITAIMNECLRETDITGRYGGEEFIILLPETKTAEVIAERIRTAIESHRFPKAEAQPGGKITASIGVAVYPGDGDTAEKIIEAADNALYYAKHNGRNTVAVYGGNAEEERTGFNFYGIK